MKRLLSVALVLMLALAGCGGGGSPDPSALIAAPIQAESNAGNIITTLENITTRPNAELKYILLKPENPSAALILFAGSHGNLRLYGSHSSPAISWGSENFLVRSRKQFADQDFVVAVVDMPTDKRTDDGRKAAKYRLSDEHVTDINVLAKSLKDEFGTPVWLVGTSMGTLSVAAIGTKEHEEISGLVLTSSVTDASFVPNTKMPNIILDLPLEKITLPTLVIHHQKDGCKYSPPKRVTSLEKALSGSPDVALVMVEGGYSSHSNPCTAETLHGFQGKEQEVVEIIAGFIKNSGKPLASIIAPN